MRDSLNANFLFIGNPWTVNELDVKGDYSLSDLKNKNKCRKFSKKTALKIEFNFFIVNNSMEPEIVFLIVFRLLGTPN